MNSLDGSFWKRFLINDASGAAAWGQLSDVTVEQVRTRRAYDNVVSNGVAVERRGVFTAPTV